MPARTGPNYTEHGSFCRSSEPLGAGERSPLQVIAANPPAVGVCERWILSDEIESRNPAADLSNGCVKMMLVL